MWKPIQLAKASASSHPKAWIAVGIGVAGVIVVLAETRRRRRRNGDIPVNKEDFGAFVERFELFPFPQPPPPAAALSLTGLTFAISDIFEVKDYLTGFGNRDWRRTHEVADKTAMAVTALLKNGAKAVGRTVTDELGCGITGENVHYGTPINPEVPTRIPGGSSSGSAVAVAAGVDIALGIDTTGCIRIPASFCGVFGYRPSHGAVSMIGVLPNSQSLDTVGLFSRNASILHRAGHALLQLKSVETRRERRLILADDLFQLSKISIQRTAHVVTKAIEGLSGYLPPKHTNFGNYIASKVPSLKKVCEVSEDLQTATSTLKALSSAMLSLQRYEFKSNHEEWIRSVKPKLGPGVSDRVYAAIKGTHENIKILYKVRTEMRAALQNLLKDDGVLVFPTVADPPLKLRTKKGLSSEFLDRNLALTSIASMSGCCQVTVPVGKHDECPISVSFLSSHGTDKFLLDTILDMNLYLQQQARVASDSLPFLDTNGDMEASQLLKEKGNAAFKGRQWNKAVDYYTEAIRLNLSNTTYYCNRAAAYLELGCFQQAEEDCSKAIELDKKNVKAYLRRGTARESLIRYKDALHDFKHAHVLEPHNKTAIVAEKRLRKLIHSFDERRRSLLA